MAVVAMINKWIVGCFGTILLQVTLGDRNVNAKCCIFGSLYNNNLDFFWNTGAKKLKVC